MLENVLNIYEGIYQKGKKVVGWGTGNYFKYFSGMEKLPIQYLVDSNPTVWGKEISGYKVYNPEQLLQEDPNNTIVVIYSTFSNDIIKQIRKMGEFASVTASTIAARKSLIAVNHKLDKEIKYRVPQRNPISDKAILVQGPVVADVTIKILGYYANLYPDDHIILSTWQDTPEYLLQELEPFIDEIVLSPYPCNAGVQNRNYQIDSTVQGINKAVELGVQYILKTRSDLIVLSTDILRQCISVQSLYDNHVCNQHGLEGRLLIPTSFTRQFLLYHPSDMVMFGRMNDMKLYWDVQHDNRSFDIAKDELGKYRTLQEFSLEMLPAECYLGVNFAKKIYGDHMGTLLRDSWRFYRDFFAILDDEWFNIFWFKNPWMPDKGTVQQQRLLVSNYFWQQIYFNNVDNEMCIQGDDFVRSTNFI